MPEQTGRALPLTGLGNAELMGDQAGRGLFDCDRMRLIGQGDIATTWGGNNRVGRRLVDTAHMPATGNRIDLIRLPETYARKNAGHVIAAVDRTAANDGRVLSLGLHTEGVSGTALIGDPVHFAGSGLSDISTRGIWTAPTTSAYYSVEITTAAGTDKFVWAKNGGSASAEISITGGWQVIDGGLEIKFAAITGHALSNLWYILAGARPTYAGSMQRQGGHVYPAMAGAKGKLLIMHGWADPLCDDGMKIRAAGLIPPQVKPTVAAASTTTTTLSSGTWVTAVEGAGVTVATTNPLPPEGSDYIKVTLPTIHNFSVDLAYENVGGTLKATTKRISFWLYIVRNKRTKEKHFSVIFASGAGLTGTRQEIKVPGGQPGRQWVKIDLKNPLTADFVYASIGIRLAGGIGTDVTQINFKGPVIDGGTAGGGDTPVSTLFSGNASQWRFVFTWYLRERDQESAPSPMSDPIVLGGDALNLDLSGNYPGIPNGLRNAPPVGVDAVHVYAFKDSFGVDSRTGGGNFFQVSPVGGYPLTDLQNVSTVVTSAKVGNTGNGAISGVLARPALDTQRVTLHATGSGPAATFTVVGAVAGAISPNATSATAYQSANDSLRFLIADGGAGWVSGDELYIDITTIPRTDGLLVLDLSDPVDDTIITSQALAPFFLGPVIPGNIAVLDGQLVVTADRPPYSVGTWAWTQNSGVITPIASTVAATPVPARWMEGRQIRKQGEAQLYYIVKALDQNADGVLDALEIAAEFDVDTQAYDGLYTGATANAKAEIVAEQRRIYWSNVSGERGVDVESFSVLNQLQVMPAGDRIVGMMKSNEFLWCLGARNSFIFKQDASALADHPQTSAYSNPLHIDGLGLIARRACCSMPDGSGYFISTRGELIQIQDSTFKVHPISDKLQSLLGGYQLLASPDRFADLWAVIVQSTQGRYVYLGMGSGQFE